MKKIYLLLSAAACLFAFSANADELVGTDGWFISGDNSTFTLSKDGKQVDIVYASEDEKNQWKAQFCSPSWEKIGAKGDEFVLKFDVKYEGDAESAIFRIASGKTFPWDANYNQGDNTQIVDEDENNVVYDSDVTIEASKWVTHEYKHFIGAEGADSIRLEIDHGIKKGTYSFRNITVAVNGKVKYAYFGATVPATTEEPATSEPAVETDLQGWEFNGKVTDVVYEQVSGVTVFVSGATNTWDAQFNPPCWIAPAKKAGAKFKISFDAKYVGESSTGGYLTMIQGGGIDPRYKALDAAGQAELVKALLGEDGAEGIDAAWKLQNALDELIVDSASVVNGVCKNGGKLTRNVEFTPTAEWQTFSFEGTIGMNGCDSVDLEFEFGKTGFNGTYGIRNFKFEVNGKVFDQEYFVPKEVGPVAVEEVAAINAYVANGVLYASEAVDVVIYNISGVAVKVAKNVTTLNVADLKSGLYIAKVGNKAIKFVK